MPRYLGSLKALALTARQGAGMYNAQIASQAKNPQVEKAADASVVPVVDPGNPELVSSVLMC